jgi:hypothetical protein
LHRASRADEEEAVPKSEAIDPTIINASGLNLAVVRGEVSSPPDVRVLPSEAVLVQLQVTTRLESETLSTPIAVWNPAAWVEELEPGTEIVVVGSGGASSGPRAQPPHASSSKPTSWPGPPIDGVCAPRYAR